MRLVVQGADRARHMAPCHLCGEPKVDQQRLAIDAGGRLVHRACKEANR